MRKTGSGRFGVLVIVAILFLVIHSLLRLGLLISSGALADGVTTAAAIVLLGVVADLYPLAMALGVGAALLALIPSFIWRTVFWRGLMRGVLTMIVAAALFEAVAETLFWAEFDTRFNFLAVEYLIYSDEVARNILESYSVLEMVAALLVAAVLLLWLLRRQLRAALEADSRPAARLAVASAGIAAALAATLLDEPEQGPNARALELSRNGAYQFVSAFRVNELDYEQFYITRPAGEVVAALSERLSPPASASGILRDVVATRPERQMNVMFISVESLSASFVGAYGAPRQLTPNLDALAAQSLWFSSVYATGTRTVRGLEALALSIPPTPGHSILKRPDSDRLRTLGTPFIARGYDVAFISGVFGYFDNMNGFFSSAGFRIVDRMAYARNEVTFSNAWGIADENVFDRVLKEADADHAANRRFFLWTLTGSNHRPYTFPAGRIDLPQGSRDAAVKYTDWVLGRFLDQVRTRPWFNNTIFVVVADHCARSGGRTELPIANFRIPLFIYAPSIIPPQRVTKQVSQIDIAPTLLNLLGFSYPSTFFGQDMLGSGPERAFLATYEALGLLRGNELTVLKPHRHAVAYEVKGMLSYEKPVDPREIDEAVTYYQGAAEAFRRGWLKLPVR